VKPLDRTVSESVTCYRFDSPSPKSTGLSLVKQSDPGVIYTPNNKALTLLILTLFGTTGMCALHISGLRYASGVHASVPGSSSRYIIYD
jgi:hypothetical protein